MIYEDLEKLVLRQKEELEQLKKAVSMLADANSYMVFAMKRMTSLLPGAEGVFHDTQRPN